MQGSTLREVAIKVAQYFQDFLESDFKRQQAPRRKIHLQSDTGFRCGMRLRPYPTLDDALWKLLSRPSGEALTLKLLPREHKRPLSATLSRVIQEQIQAIPESALVIVRGEVLGEIDKTWAKAVQDPEAWVEGVRGTLAQGLSQHVVRPLIAHLDGPLRSQAYSVIDSLYAAEGDMVAAVGCDVDALLPDVLAKHLAHESARQQGVVKGALEGFLTLPLAQTALQAFFASFVTADAYLEFRDIETYATINEGLQLYLYMGALQHRGNQYPLFFAPVQVDKLADGSGFQLTVVNQLFANRSAIDFVLQEIAAQRQREWVSPITERINYLTPEQSLYEVTRGLFALVANAVDLAGQVQFSSRSADASTADVKLSAQLHLCAFDRGVGQRLRAADPRGAPRRLGHCGPVRVDGRAHAHRQSAEHRRSRGNPVGRPAAGRPARLRQPHPAQRGAAAGAHGAVQARGEDHRGRGAARHRQEPHHHRDRRGLRVQPAVLPGAFGQTRGA
jgi:hypothetical protein